MGLGFRSLITTLAHMVTNKKPLKSAQAADSDIIILTIRVRGGGGGRRGGLLLTDLR